MRALTALAPRQDQARVSRHDRNARLELIGELASGIAHEINTPMQYVLFNVSYLGETFETLLRLVREGEAADRNGQATPGTWTARLKEAGFEELANEIPAVIAQSLAGLRQVAAILGAVKDFGHPGIGTDDPVQINDCVQNAVTISRNEWKYVSEIALDLAPDLPEISGNAAEIQQVLLNLLINAAHAIADRALPAGGKGRISIATRAVGRCIEIRVADTGCGIPEANRSRIFQPFFTTKAVGRGTGRGLAFVHSLITKGYGGSITFESEVGRGTTFIVRVPVKADTSSPGAM